MKDDKISVHTLLGAPDEFRVDYIVSNAKNGRTI